MHSGPGRTALSSHPLVERRAGRDAADSGQVRLPQLPNRANLRGHRYGGLPELPPEVHLALDEGFDDLGDELAGEAEVR